MVRDGVSAVAATAKHAVHVLCCAAILLALTAQSAFCQPRIIDEDADAVRGARFLKPERVGADEAPRSISPRNSATNSTPKTAGKNSSAAGTASLWGTMLGLGAIFAIFFVARIWLTQHGPAGMRGLPVEALELLGKRTLEPRASIHLVRCGPKILVLGVGPDGIRTLSEITEPIEIDLLAGACRRKDSPARTAAGFAHLMRSDTAVSLSRGDG